MTLSPIFRLAGAVALTLGLAGCIDMTSDVYVTSPTTAKATITSTMSSEVYAMFKSGAAGDDEEFCAEAGSSLTENADGSATCVAVSEGPFADLNFDNDDDGSKPVFTTNPDGTVRIALATESLVGDLGMGDDEETAAMLKALFDGHFLTLRFGGAQIVESNMERAPDSANYVEMQLPFLGLMDGSLELPPELYAVIRP